MSVLRLTVSSRTRLGIVRLSTATCLFQRERVRIGMLLQQVNSYQYLNEMQMLKIYFSVLSVVNFCVKIVKSLTLTKSVQRKKEAHESVQKRGEH